MNGPNGKKPLLIGLITLIGLALAILAQSVVGNTRSTVESAASSAVATESTGPGQPLAPVDLQSAIEALGRAEQGKNGILVRSVEENWVAGFRGATTFSQGTTRRIWLGAALLDAVDHGELSLEQEVPLPAYKHNGQESRQKVGELLRRALAHDDRASQDHILDGLTGPAGMARWLEEKGVQEVAFGPANRDLEKIFGRKSVQATTRPPDEATPDGMAFGLAELFAGKLLSDSSTQILLGQFGGASTHGGQVKASWQLQRMTDETVATGGQVVAASGVALVRSHTGRRFIVVAFAEGRINATQRRDRLLAGTIMALENAEMR